MVDVLGVVLYRGEFKWIVYVVDFYNKFVYMVGDFVFGIIFFFFNVGGRSDLNKDDFFVLFGVYFEELFKGY